MRCTYSIEETKEPCLSLYSDSIGFNSGKRPSLYSDKHGGTDSGVNDVLCHKSSPHKLITTIMQKLEEAICQRSTQDLEQIW